MQTVGTKVGSIILDDQMTVKCYLSVSKSFFLLAKSLKLKKIFQTV